MEHRFTHHHVEAWPIGALAALSIVACGGGAAEDGVPAFADEVSGGVYIALGDSIAAGSGASDPATTSYTGLIADRLRDALGPTLELESFAVGGHTTEDLIETQLGPAINLLQEESVRLVTLTIGGNDLGLYAGDPACVRDPADPDCALRDGLLQVEQRLDEIFGGLREADPDVAIVAQLYPNLFSGTGHEFTFQAETAFGMLNGVIAGVARSHDVLLADPRQSFQGEGRRLTHLLDPAPDAHPNDAGYHAIAEAFLAVLGLVD